MLSEREIGSLDWEEAEALAGLSADAVKESLPSAIPDSRAARPADVGVLPPPRAGGGDEQLRPSSAASGAAA